MEYSPVQVALIRKALLDYRALGGGGARPLSWPYIVGQICLYTDLEIGTDNEQADLINVSEALRQFAQGKSSKFSRKPRNIDAKLLRSVAEFLSHEEIGFLAPENSFPDDVSLSFAPIAVKMFSSKIETDSTENTLLNGCWAGISYAPDDQLKSMISIDVTKGYFLSHVHLEIADTSDHSILMASCVRIAPFPKSLSKRRERMDYNTTYSGFAIKLSSSDAYVFLYDTITNDLNLIKITIYGDEGTKSVKALVTRLDEALDKTLLPDEIGPLFQNPRLREGLDHSEARTSAIWHYYKNTGILEKVNSNYILDDMEMNLNIIRKSYSMDEIFYEHDEIIRKASRSLLIFHSEREWYVGYVVSEDKELLDVLKSGKIPDIRRAIKSGIRLDYQDTETGLTALHILAHRGYRDGVMAALKRSDLCNFTLRDKRGLSVSDHAFAYGRDEALARLIGIYERRAGLPSLREWNTRSVPPTGPMP